MLTSPTSPHGLSGPCANRARSSRQAHFWHIRHSQRGRCWSVGPGWCDSAKRRLRRTRRRRWRACRDSRRTGGRLRSARPRPPAHRIFAEPLAPTYRHGGLILDRWGAEAVRRRAQDVFSLHPAAAATSCGSKGRSTSTGVVFQDEILDAAPLMACLAGRAVGGLLRPHLKFNIDPRRHGNMNLETFEANPRIVSQVCRKAGNLLHDF